MIKATKNGVCNVPLPSFDGVFLLLFDKNGTGFNLSIANELACET